LRLLLVVSGRYWSGAVAGYYNELVGIDLEAVVKKQQVAAYGL
jgi:hypothetical protein